MDNQAELKESGYSFVRQAFSSSELESISHSIINYIENKDVGIVREKDNKTIRGIHGVHLYDELFAQLVRDSRLVNIAEQILESEVYVHQTKINFKLAGYGEHWPWHQDFVYWSKKDGVQRPNLINAALLLDNSSMNNGPLRLIPKSHKSGDITDIINEGDKGWLGNVSSDLTYQVSDEQAEAMVKENGLEYLIGKKGDLLFFDPLLVHGSTSNNSSESRRMLIITYNRVDNGPTDKRDSIRPEFLCAKDMSPIISKKNALADFLGDSTTD